MPPAARKTGRLAGHRRARVTDDTNQDRHVARTAIVVGLIATLLAAGIGVGGAVLGADLTNAGAAAQVRRDGELVAYSQFLSTSDQAYDGFKAVMRAKVRTLQYPDDHRAAHLLKVRLSKFYDSHERMSRAIDRLSLIGSKKAYRAATAIDDDLAGAQSVVTTQNLDHVLATSGVLGLALSQDRSKFVAIASSDTQKG